MAEEKVIPAVKARSLFRDWGEFQHKAVKKSYDTLKPCCLRCMKIDYDHGELKDLDHYFGLKYKLVQKVELWDRKDPHKRLGENWEYMCQKGHGITIRVEEHRFDRDKIKRII